MSGDIKSISLAGEDRLPGHNHFGTIKQLSSGRFLDAYESQAQDFSVVTRGPKSNAQGTVSFAQVWRATPLSADIFTIQQYSSRQFLDAHEIEAKDFRAVTRDPQGNDTQRWKLTLLGGLYHIENESQRRLLDAHDLQAQDFAAVTRDSQGNDTQLWILRPLGRADNFTIQQYSSRQFLDAHEIEAKDFRAVTRGPQSFDHTQRWVIK